MNLSVDGNVLQSWGRWEKENSNNTDHPQVLSANRRLELRRALAAMRLPALHTTCMRKQVDSVHVCWPEWQGGRVLSSFEKPKAGGGNMVLLGDAHDHRLG